VFLTFALLKRTKALIVGNQEEELNVDRKVIYQPEVTSVNAPHGWK